MQLLQNRVTCSNPSKTNIKVAGGYPILSLKATGYITYFCVDSVLDHDGEAFAQVESDDGVWVGSHEYPTSGPSLGQPTWFLHNTITGENRTIYGENKPMVRQDAPNGSAVDWWRRMVYGDSGTVGPKAWYVIRDNTTSGIKPKGDRCNGDIDENLNFTAWYTFISCDYYRGPPPPPPPEPALPPSEDEIPLLLAALAQIQSSMLAPSPAPSPADVITVDRVVLAGPLPSPPSTLEPLVPMPVPVPVAVPVNKPVIMIKSGASVSSSHTAAMFVMITAILLAARV